MKYGILTLLTLFSLPSFSSENMCVIVHRDNSVDALNQKETVDIFMGRTAQFKNGQSTYAIDQPSKSDLKEDFYLSLTGKPISYVNAYWARLFYTGRKTPPADHFNNTVEIVNEVSRNKQAIAYVECNTPLDAVKVVLSLKKNKN